MQARVWLTGAVQAGRAAAGVRGATVSWCGFYVGGVVVIFMDDKGTAPLDLR